MNYKHIGRRAMKSAISSAQIATEQYSHPQCRAIDHALNRKLVMDHQLYKRQPYAITSCDLKSCYDCILYNLASISLQRIGIPRTEVVTMFDSIQRMTHSVRTTFGDSILSYGGDVNNTKWKSPPQGVLQGNGCGPAIWSILSSVIFSILHKKGCQNRFVSPIRKMLLRLAEFAYVDDSDLIQADETTQRVIRGMQRKLNQWIDTIGVTGGILAPLKCWWYLVTYKYKLGKWKAVSPQTNAEL
jgi:Reverse transcriptase (RNA-dependent DNA polymerase).